MSFDEILTIMDKEINHPELFLKSKEEQEQNRKELTENICKMIPIVKQKMPTYTMSKSIYTSFRIKNETPLNELEHILPDCEIQLLVVIFHDLLESLECIYDQMKTKRERIYDWKKYLPTYINENIK